MEAKWSIDKLGGQNYETWRFQVTHYLKAKDLWKYVEEAPQEGVNDAVQRQKALSELVMSVKPECIYLMTSCTDPHAVWVALENHFRRRTTANKLFLKKSYFRCSMGEDISLEQHLKNMKMATDKLNGLGCEVSEEDQIATLLGSLPSRFSSIVTALEARVDELTLEFTIQALLNEEQKSVSGAGVNGAVSQDSVMKNSGGFSKKKSRVTCFYCGKQGHMKYQCKKKKAETKSTSGPESTSTTKTATVSSHDNSMGAAGDTAFKMEVRDLNHVNMTPGRFLVDCGATSHIIRNEDQFVEFDEHFDPIKHTIELADGSRKRNVAKKRGKAAAQLIDDTGQMVNVTLDNALWIPDYPSDIFSVQRATEKGAMVHLKAQDSMLTSSNGKRFPISKCGKLFYLTANQSEDSANVVRSASLQEWHEVLGHCNVNDVTKLEKVVKGMKIDNRSKFSCDVCIQAKQCVTRERGPRDRATHILDLVHSDIAGPITPTGKFGYRYVITFVDDYSGYIFLYLLKSKAAAVDALKLFLADASPYGSPKVLRSDNGSEFTSTAFKNVLIEKGIRQEFSAPYSPHQNGTAERPWRTLFEMARAMILKSKLRKSMWIYAIMTSVYVRNRCYCNRTGQTPHYLMTGKVPDLSSMHEFGSKCFAYDHGQKGKLDARNNEAIFVGMAKRSPAYMVYDPQTNVVMERRCVLFPNEAKTLEEVRPESQRDEIDVHTLPEQLAPADVHDSAVTLPVRRNPERDRRMPVRFDDYSMLSNDVDIDYCYRMANVSAPSTYDEAISDKDSEAWVNAMDSEMQSLDENCTWHLSVLPEGKKPIGCKWVYTHKFDKNGMIKSYKARLVAQGFSQTKGQDYSETFSPTVRMTTVRALVQIAVNHDWHVVQMDVKSAYLNAELDYDVYMHQPLGYERDGQNGEQLYCQLKKSLYGLKQSGRLWNQLLNDCLTSFGFRRSDIDTCLYLLDRGGSSVRMIVFVDDIILASNDDSLLTEVKAMLQERFKMTDLGDLNWFLGIEFERGADYYALSQSHYFEKLLEKHGMSNCKAASTPCAEKQIFDGDENPSISNETYRSIVGSLIYAMTCTRPDLCWVVSRLSQFLNEPVTNARWTAVKRVLRYIQGTRGQKLYFRKTSVTIVGFCDSSWGEKPDRKSTSGWCFTLNSDSGMIVWKSKKQKCVALSSCEAEYLSMASAVQEGLYISQLICDIDVIDHVPSFTLKCDNQGAIMLTQKAQVNDRTKHVDVKIHFVRHHVAEGNVVLEYLPTQEMVADCLTKPLGRQLFVRFRQSLFSE